MVIPCPLARFHETLELVDENFLKKTGRTGSMRTRYPGVWTEDNIENIFVIIKDGLVVSCAGVKKFRCRMGNSVVDAAMVGGVLTREEYRGQGLATAVMRAVDDALRGTCAFAVLWTQISPFYTRNGWQLADDAVLGKLSQFSSSKNGFKLVKGTPEDMISVIESLRPEQSPYVVRTRQDYRTIPVFARNVECMVAEVGGEAVSYVLTGNGGTTGYVLEAGGELDAVLGILERLARDYSVLLLNDHKGGRLHHNARLARAAAWSEPNLSMWREYGPSVFGEDDVRYFSPFDRI